MVHEIPKETLYAILIAASLDDTSVFYGKDPGWTRELDNNKTLRENALTSQNKNLPL